MVEFDQKIYEQGLMYVKQEIVKILGEEVTIIPNDYVVAMFNKHVDIERVAEGLKVILSALELKIKYKPQKVVETKV